jgi:hypothetical protein
VLVGVAAEVGVLLAKVVLGLGLHFLASPTVSSPRAATAMLRYRIEYMFSIIVPIKTLSMD